MATSFRTAACRVVARAIVLASSVGVCVGVAFAETETAPIPGSLRELFPPSSIQSTERADAALASTSGAKARVEKQFKVEARDCNGFLVNRCLDEARQRQRERLGEIDAVELEANRYKRRDKADRIEAERARRETEREAGADADRAQRARNQKAFDDKQVQRQRDAALQARSKAVRAAPSPHPAIRTVKPATAELQARQRAKNVADHDIKVREAATHEKDIERRLVAKTADRKRRDDEKKAREAKAAATAAAVIPRT